MSEHLLAGTTLNIKVPVARLDIIKFKLIAAVLANHKAKNQDSSWEPNTKSIN